VKWNAWPIAARLEAYFLLSLCLAGIIVLASASGARGVALKGDSFHFLNRQVIWLAVGLVGAGVLSLVDYRRWRSLAPWLTLVTFGLLILVLLVGRRINGCLRWLELGPVNFQPSELAKFVTILLLAWWFARAPLRVGQMFPRTRGYLFREGLLLPGLILGGMMGLVLMEPDLGATAMIGMIAWLLMVVAGGNLKWLLPAAVFVAAGLAVYVWNDPHRCELVMAWWDPDGHPKLAFHYLEARKAFMLGGWTGVGYTGGLEKRFFLPEVHTDFIFPVAAEEMGLWGTLGIVLLFAGFFYNGVSIALRAPDFFGHLLGVGITLLITLQAVLNMFVVTGMVPTKGLALPFFSYGGSNLMITLMQCGILLSIGRVGGHWRKPEEKAKSATAGYE
jgi:cell division protein FtsW